MPGDTNINSNGRKRIAWHLAWVIVPVLLLIALVTVNARLNGAADRWIAPTTDSVILPSKGLPFLASLGLAASATTFALLLGFPVGVSLGRKPKPILIALAFIPILIPANLAAYLWRFTLEDIFALVVGNAGLWRTAFGSFLGGGWTLGAILWPFIALPTALVMFARGNRLEQELATLAPPRAVFWRAIVPGLFPAILGGAGAVFLLALSNYGVPLMWNLPSQNVAVFARLAAFYEPTHVLIMSLPLLGVTFLLCASALAWTLTKRHDVDLGEWSLRSTDSRAWTPTWPDGFAALTLLLTVVGPVASLLASPSLLRGARLEFVAGASPFLNGICLAMMAPPRLRFGRRACARLLRRAHRAWQIFVELLGLCLLFMPATILCIALSAMQSGPAPLVAVYQSTGVFFIAFGLRFFYIPWKVTNLVQRMEGPGHDDMARIMGLSRFTRARLSFGGVLKPALAVSGLIVFALALGELEISTFLCSPGWRPISVFLDNLMHYGRSADVAQWSLIVIFTETIIAWALLAVGHSQWRKLRASA